MDVVNCTSSGVPTGQQQLVYVFMVQENNVSCTVPV